MVAYREDWYFCRQYPVVAQERNYISVMVVFEYLVSDTDDWLWPSFAKGWSPANKEREWDGRKLSLPDGLKSAEMSHSSPSTGKGLRRPKVGPMGHERVFKIIPRTCPPKRI